MHRTKPLYELLDLRYLMFTFNKLLISVGSKLIDSLSKKSPRRHSENFADSTPQFKNQRGVLFKNSTRMFQFLCLTSLALSVGIFQYL